MREHEIEPVYGLPEKLPAGEQILWQGGPNITRFSYKMFRLPWLVGYFCLIIFIALVADDGQAGGTDLRLAGALSVAALAVCVSGLIFLMGRLIAKAAIYTITNQRVVFRVGVALPIIINVPLKSIKTISVKLTSSKFGDISLGLMPQHEVAWLALWPHCRSIKRRQTVPVLRCLDGHHRVAEILAAALADDQIREGFKSHGLVKESLSPVGFVGKLSNVAT